MNQAPFAAPAGVEEEESGPAVNLGQAQTLLDALPDGCLLTSADGGIRHANIAAARMFGYAREELQALDVNALLPSRVRGSHPQRIAGLVRDPLPCPMSSRGDLRALRRDGSEFPVEVSLSALALNGEPMVLAVVRDITERQRAEAALEESDCLSAEIIAAAQEGVIVYGLDLRYRVWNPFMEQLTGMSAREVLGRHPREVFPFLADAGIISRIEAALAGEMPAVVELPFEVKSTGRSGWVADRTAPLRNARGEIVGAIATVADISEMRRGQEQMRLAREFFESTFAAAAIGMALIDIKGRYLRVNPAMTRFVGYSEAELLTMSYMDVTHPDELDANVAVRASLLAGEVPTFRMEKRFIHKDGRAIWALLVVSLVTGKDGRPLYSIGQMLDIDKQKRAEQALRLSEERFRGIFENASTAIAVTAADGRIAAFNEAFRMLLGYDADALRQMNIADFTDPGDVDQQTLLVGELLSGRRESYRTERRYVRRDGNVVTVDISVSAIRDARDRVLNMVGVANNITERKQTELSLIESRRQLRDLAVHQEGLLELERKHIAREIHDELGQLLTALKMDISLLRLSFGHDPGVLKKTKEMRALVERTIEVVRQVASNLRPAALDLGLVAAIEWLAGDHALRYGTACRVAVSGDDAALDDATATAIFRVVQESLTNVARHARAGEVTISLHRGAHRLQLEVRDDGRGFDPAMVRKKAGFGLFAMRERILALGGTLRISSAPGEGTTVVIELPLARGDDQS